MPKTYFPLSPSRFVKTDARGEFIARTIRPISYGNDEGEKELAHVHFDATKKGCRAYNSEFVFENDSLMTEQVLKDLEEIGIPVAKVIQKKGGLDCATVTIRMQPQ